MSSQSCPDLTTPGSQWSFCPNIDAAYVMCVFFGLTFLAHIGQGIYYKKWYCWVICMSALWQTIAYIFRIVSIKTPTSLADYAAWFVLILVAPLWTNAFVYMVLGRMVWNFTRRAKIFGISAWRIGMVFVLLDIVAFIIQVAGAAMAASTLNNDAAILNDLHIYMAGVGIQQLFILIFTIYAISLHRTILAEKPQHTHKALILLYTLYACLALITTRIVFRLIEYSKGLHSTIPNHEVFQYCLDSLPMLVALVLLNVVHPGSVMNGEGSELPSRKERKAGAVSKFEEVEKVGQSDGSFGP